MLEFDELVINNGLDALRAYFPHVRTLKTSDIIEVMTKEDGSLISTFLDANNELQVKTKGSLTSEQAIAAQALIDSDQYSFKQQLGDLTERGYTVNMEYVGPANRIVLSYSNSDLRVLNIRHRETGEYVGKDTPWLQNYDEVLAKWVVLHDLNNFSMDDVSDMTGIEGFVVRFNDGLHAKLKCRQYLALHSAKDSIMNPKQLFAVVLEEAADDLRSLFVEDSEALKIIDAMQTKVTHIYNHLVATVEGYYEANKHLDRKTYAINAMELGQYHGLCMNKYLGKADCYKEFLLKNYREYVNEAPATNHDD